MVKLFLFTSLTKINDFEFISLCRQHAKIYAISLLRGLKYISYCTLNTTLYELPEQFQGKQFET